MPDLKNIRVASQPSSELSGLFKRMDEDADLYHMKKYQMVDKIGALVPGVVNVTLNYLGVFAAQVLAAMMTAAQQIRVTGKDSHGLDLEDKVTVPIKEFANALLNMGDANLRARGEMGLRPHAAEQIDIRGRVVARILLDNIDGKLDVDIRPMDARYFTYGMDKKGMKWSAYQSWRMPLRILDEYPNAKVNEHGTDALLVTETWDLEKEEIFVQKALVRPARENKWGEVPNVLNVVPLGSSLRTATSEHTDRRGESIFYLVREMYDELNRLVSIVQTLNINVVAGALQYESRLGANATVPKSVRELQTTTAVEIGGGLKLIPTADINEATRLARDILERLLQAGSLSLTNVGSLDFPLSAVALIEVGESQNQVFLPRLGTMGLFFQNIIEMAIRQLEILKMPVVDLGAKGHERAYKTEALTGAYDISLEYTVTSPQMDVARLAMASQAREAGYDELTIMRDILAIEDPEEVMRRRKIQEAEELDPVLKLFRISEALIKERKNREAFIIAKSMERLIEQLEAPDLPRAPGRGTPEKLSIPMINDRSASNTRATSLQPQPGANGVAPTGR